MPRYPRRSSVVGSLALVLVGCGLGGAVVALAQQANVLAKVGDRVITVQELEDRLKALPDAARDRLLQRDNLRIYLKGMVLKELFAREAQRLGVDKDPVVRAQLDEARRNVLYNALTGRALSSITVTDAEMSSYFQLNRSEFGGKSYEDVKSQIAQRLRETKAREAMDKIERDASAQWPVTVNEALLKTVSVSKNQSKKDVEKAIEETERRVGPLPEETKRKLREGNATVVTPTPAK